jgi:dienelactone hydrolase
MRSVIGIQCISCARSTIQPRGTPVARLLTLALLMAGIFSGAFAGLARAEKTRVLPAGKLPNDQRLGPLKNLDGYFPFTPSKTVQEWNTRADYVRRQTLVALGLWPIPAEVGTPVKATVHGKVERDDFTVERIFFESAPGLYVTGSLFRPKGKSGKLPGVLCPHGHWSNGRFYKHGDEAFKRELEIGAEKLDPSGRYPLQARCVQLARMGCVVFHYDMMGVADSVPIPASIVHGFRTQRPHLSTPERWGFYSAQAESRLLNIMGMQTLNSIRALDWLMSLPDVDPGRIGVTGASGGGTQTFILGAIDSRPTVAFPAVMVSTAMQGGCTCENACYLRVNTGNIELAALFGPRALAMSAANDWTKELLTKGVPELKRHYALLGVEDRVAAKYFNFDHNYNLPSRTMMYEWFNQHLALGQKSPIVEQDFRPLSIDELTVWNERHPKPAMDEDAEVRLVKGFDQRSTKQIAVMSPRDAKSLAEFRRIVGGAFEAMIGRPMPVAGDVELEKIDEQDRGNYIQFKSLVRNTKHGEELPAVFLLPKNWKKHVVLWVSDNGKVALFDGDRPTAAVQKLIDAGAAVAGVDLLYQGEFLTDGQPLGQARRVENNNREFAGYTLGYNHPLFAQRVHDILTLVTFIKHNDQQPEKVYLVGTRGAGAIVAAAAAMAGDSVHKVAIDTGGFRFSSITDIRDVNLWPGAVKYGDLPALLALSAPRPLWLAGETKGPGIVQQAYAASRAADSVALNSQGTAEAMIAWLLQ